MWFGVEDVVCRLVMFVMIFGDGAKRVCAAEPNLSADLGLR